MKNIKITLFIFLLFALFGCENSYEKMPATSSNNYENPNEDKALASNGNIKDSDNKIIRTADLKFRVKDVINAIYNIENITKNNEGFVTYTHLLNSNDYQTTTPISKDSILESMFFTISNTIILRVPNSKLDNTLIEISKIIDFLDYRTIKADDVSLQILANKMTIKNNKDIKYKTKKYDDSPTFYNLNQQSRDAYISNLSLEDQINYSTLNLTIYQRQSIKREVLASNKNIEEYRPSFGRKIYDSIVVGWEILSLFIIFIFRFWTLFLVGFVVYFLIKKYKFFTKK